MTNMVNGSLKKVFIISALIVIVLAVFSLISIDESWILIMIGIVGWATACINYILLNIFVKLLFAADGKLKAILFGAVRYLIYGISAVLCINGVKAGVAWSMGMISVVIGIIINSLIKTKR